MDRWKSRGGKRQRGEEQKREDKRRERARRKKKEDAGARKNRKVAKHCVFPMICGSGRSKSRLAKVAGAETSGQMRDEKFISQAVGLQVHLVTTLMSRTEHFAHDDLERFNSPRIRTATPCSCVPLRRMRSKISACTGACRVFSEVIKPGSVETSFLDNLSSCNPIPENLRQTLAVHYIKFHRFRSLPRVLGPVGRLLDFSSVTSGRNRISQLAARTLASYLSAPHWFVPVRGATAEERASWIELSLDLVATHGWQPGWIHSELTLGKLARPFSSFRCETLESKSYPNSCNIIAAFVRIWFQSRG